jgi:hypothetical protein
MTKGAKNHWFWLLENLLGHRPAGDVLVIDGKHGKEELSDKEIDAMFVAKK